MTSTSRYERHPATPLRSRDHLTRLGLRVKHAADARVLVVVAVNGIAFDWAAHKNFNSVAGTAFFCVLALSLALSKRFHRTESLSALATVPIFASFLMLRTSTWLVLPDIAAILLALATAASFSTGGSMLELTVGRISTRSSSLVDHAFRVPPFLYKPISTRMSARSGRTKSILTGLLLIAPVFAILTMLLASADSVFASFLIVDVHQPDLFGHGCLLIVGCWGTAALLRAASGSEPVGTDAPRWRLGHTEVFVALAAVLVLYVMFVATQVVVWFGGASKVLDTAGLTYAEHARQGFFQLVVVGVITLALLTTARSHVRLETPRQNMQINWLVLVTAALTVVIVGESLHRLFMYEAAYGLTMLRLYSSVVAAWIGVVFVLFAISTRTPGDQPSWFAVGVVGSGLVILLALDIADPERIVIERNIDRMETATIPFDYVYTRFLSDDAVPALVSALPQLDETTRENLLSELCARDRDRDTKRSASEWNLSHSRATDALKSACDR